MTTPRRPGAAVDLEGVCRDFGPTRAVDDVDLHLAPGSFTALVGPSGCGKSTLLSLVAGLEQPDAGDVVLDGTSIVAVPAERRGVGIVFQRPLLFPHLTVEANVAFGLRRRGVGRRPAAAAARAMLERVGLGGLDARRVGQLSGGQEQRVALARALVLEPRVLLLDEPFSALDAPLRATMRHLVRELTADLKVTTVFVTHDQAEAVAVADDIALMLAGRLVAHAAAPTFYADPPTLEAARFFAAVNELPGAVRGGRFTVAAAGVSGPRCPSPLSDGRAVLVVRPEAFRVVDDEESRRSGSWSVEGTATALRFAGTHQVLHVELRDGLRLLAHVPVGVAVALGAPVTLEAPVEQTTVLASDAAEER